MCSWNEYRSFYDWIFPQQAIQATIQKAALLLLSPKQNQQQNYLKWEIWKSEIKKRREKKTT